MSTIQGKQFVSKLHFIHPMDTQRLLFLLSWHIYSLRMTYHSCHLQVYPFHMLIQGEIFQLQKQENHLNNEYKKSL